MNLQLSLLLGYALVLIVVGLAIGRRVESTGAFFVAGRSLGPGLLFATMLAANIGAGSTVGASGLGYANGLAGWWWVGSAGVGTLLLSVWIGPRIWRIAKEHDLRTVGDFLEWRYGQAVRATIAILLWLGTLAILAGQLIAMSWILDVVAGVPKVWGCLIGGGVMTAYFAAGGLLTSAWVNLLQLVVLIAGFAIALPWAWVDVGGWSAIAAAAPAQTTTWLDFWHSGPSGYVYLILLVPAFLVSPGLLQKIYGARDERTVRLGVGLSAAALLLFAAVPPLLGMVARAYAPGLENPELALPTLLGEALPFALGTLALGAVLSAEISSADAILFMLSTSLSEDLYKRFLRPQATDREVLRMARIAAVAGGGLGIFLAVVLPSVIGALTIFYSLLGVSLLVPIVAGLHTGKPGQIEIMVAIVGGVGTLLVARWTGLSSGLFTPETYGLLASALLFLAACGVQWMRSKEP